MIGTTGRYNRLVDRRTDRTAGRQADKYICREIDRKTSMKVPDRYNRQV